MIETTGFVEGESYTRKEIALKLGGSTQKYLPHKNKYVVCGCFRMDLNPKAPREVLPANTDDKRRWAEQFARQTEAVPIFIKQGTDKWEYQGLWRCVSMTKDRSVLTQKAKESCRSSIAMVLNLEKAA